MSRDPSHEGLVVTDGRNRFLIRNGQRVWLNEPPEGQRQELLIEADRLARSLAIRATAHDILRTLKP